MADHNRFVVKLELLVRQQKIAIRLGVWFIGGGELGQPDVVAAADELALEPHKPIGIRRRVGAVEYKYVRHELIIAKIRASKETI